MPIAQQFVVVANRTRTMSFQVLSNFYAAVTLALTGNLTFPTPPVSLIDQGTNQGAFQTAIDQWGAVGNRGSHAEYIAVLATREQVLLDLASLAGYVQAQSRLVNLGSISDQIAAVLSAGMRAKNASNALATWGVVNNFRQLIKQNLVGSGAVNLRWSKPNVMPGANSKPPAYNIYESPDGLLAYTIIATVSNTSFLNTGVGQGNFHFYKVSAVSAAGEGVISAPILCFGQ